MKPRPKSTRIGIIIMMVLLVVLFSQYGYAESLIQKPTTRTWDLKDSAKITDDYSRYTAKIELPVVNGPVRDSIYAFVYGFLGQKDSRSIEDAFRKGAKQYFANYRKEISEDGGGGFAWYYDVEISLETYCSKFITLHVIGYDYLGGAHGMPFDYGVTFLTSNGKCLKWNDFTSRGEFMRPTISNALDTKDEDEVSTIFPLPARDPWIIGTELMFKYCPYEIGPFVMGMPESKLHFTRLEEWLKPEIVDLCKTYYEEENGMEYGTGPDFDASSENVTKMMADELDGNFKVTGAPNIKTFVEATLGKAGYEFDNDHFDIRNGYFDFFEEGDGSTWVNAAYWNRNDGKKLFIISWNIVSLIPDHLNKGKMKGVQFASSPWMRFDITRESEDFFRSKDSGYLTYIYNEKTRTLEIKYDMSLLGNMPEASTHRCLILPRNGKDIKVKEENSNGVGYRYRTLKWNGLTFRDGMHTED